MASTAKPIESDGKVRCRWCTSDAIYIQYHDEEWGQPLHDERALFELLNLEGQQAGLSWITVLKKREHYRKCFAGFDAQKVARFSDDKLEKLLLDPGIIRNRLKVYGIRKNAHAYLEHFSTPGSFNAFLWAYAETPTSNKKTKASDEVVVSTAQSDAMSKALKKKGFTFIGTTICYAFMQASGMVNDHMTGCWRRRN